jgi:hypothetical protein
MIQVQDEPQRVRLTKDYLDLHVGLAYRAGTILIRSPHGTGQYFTEQTRLGEMCVAGFSKIRDICEVVP